MTTRFTFQTVGVTPCVLDSEKPGQATPFAKEETAKKTADMLNDGFTYFAECFFWRPITEIQNWFRS